MKNVDPGIAHRRSTGNDIDSQDSICARTQFQINPYLFTIDSHYDSPILRILLHCDPTFFIMREKERLVTLDFSSSGSPPLES